MSPALSRLAAGTIIALVAGGGAIAISQWRSSIATAATDTCDLRHAAAAEAMRLGMTSAVETVQAQARADVARLNAEHEARLAAAIEADRSAASARTIAPACLIDRGSLATARSIK